MLTSLPADSASGNAQPSAGTIAKALKELQGLRLSVVAGAAAGTAMAIAALRTEDTIVGAVVTTDAGGALADDSANITIQPTKASGTLTISGNPVSTEVFTVNGVTYTFKDAPTNPTDVKITAGDVTAMAAAVVVAVNNYETRRTTDGSFAFAPQVVATSSAGVVTLTSVADGVGNAPVVTGTVTVLAAAGSGTASATLTPVTVIADNTCVVNGITFTAKVAPAASGAVGFDVQFPTTATAGSDLLCGIALANKINAYQFKYGTLDVTASANSATGVVTLVPASAKKGNIIPLTESATNVVVSGATLAGGTVTGGIKSTTALTGKSLIVAWFNKQ